MPKKRVPPQSSQDIYSSSSRPPVKRTNARHSRANRPEAYNGEIDRYNYVDRNIYSRAGKRSGVQSSRTQKAAKRTTQHSSHRILKTFLLLLFFVGIGVLIYGGIMFQRLKHTDVDTSAYVQQPSDAPKWDVISEDKVTNILLIGMDKGDDGKSHRSDTTMLLSIDKQTKKIRLVSFLRDLYLEIPTVGKTKLNAAFSSGGPALTMQTLENNFRINIDKYVSIDFDNFENLIDKMGGIDIDMSAKAAKEENHVMGSHLHEGVNHLNGKLALYYARIRIIDDDFGRTGRQRQVMEAIISKMKTLNPLKLNSVMYDYLQYVQTNLSDAELLYLVSLAPSAVGYEMETMHIPLENTYEDKKIKGSGMVLIPDLPKNCKLLREFLYPLEKSSSTDVP